MAMSRKHYESIAAAIKSSQDDSGNSGDDLIVQRATVNRVANALCDVLALDNPNFDGRRFLAACGVL